MSRVTKLMVSRAKAIGTVYIILGKYIKDVKLRDRIFKDLDAKLIMVDKEERR